MSSSRTRENWPTNRSQPDFPFPFHTRRNLRSLVPGMSQDCPPAWTPHADILPIPRRMYATQAPWVTLYHQLMDYDGGDAYADVLAAWPAEHEDERRWLAELAARAGEDWGRDAGEDLCRLYAAFRVASALLLRFQEG